MALGMTERATRYWIRTTYATAVVDTNAAGVIVWTAPIYNRYRGKTIDAMIDELRCMRKLKEWQKLDDIEL